MKKRIISTWRLKAVVKNGLSNICDLKGPKEVKLELLPHQKISGGIEVKTQEGETLKGKLIFESKEDDLMELSLHIE